MITARLPATTPIFAALCGGVFAAAGQAQAEEALRLPGLGGAEGGAVATLPECEADLYGQNNCVRVLACIGDEGLWLDGQARGWGKGTILAVISDGTPCAGTWRADGPLGFGLAEATCEDGVTMQAVYTTRDDETGTAIGTGRDSLGRQIRAWSGLYVLDFLRGEGETPKLPCGPTDIPIS